MSHRQSMGGSGAQHMSSAIIPLLANSSGQRLCSQLDTLGRGRASLRCRSSRSASLRCRSSHSGGWARRPQRPRRRRRQRQRWRACSRRRCPGWSVHADHDVPVPVVRVAHHLLHLVALRLPLRHLEHQQQRQRDEQHLHQQEQQQEHDRVRQVVGTAVTVGTPRPERRRRRRDVRAAVCRMVHRICHGQGVMQHHQEEGKHAARKHAVYRRVLLEVLVLSIMAAASRGTLLHLRDMTRDVLAVSGDEPSWVVGVHKEERRHDGCVARWRRRRRLHRHGVAAAVLLPADLALGVALFGDPSLDARMVRVRLRARAAARLLQAAQRVLLQADSADGY
mmetsp:Transcript_14924/g.43857  ORF Transcript_14924/g.43857 Transcript_14924/m.43857 type:complete len:336 (+) Transcript_14924:74-1081(+)